jgi:hypothetical protein
MTSGFSPRSSAATKADSTNLARSRGGTAAFNRSTTWALSRKPARTLSLFGLAIARTS